MASADMEGGDAAVLVGVPRIVLGIGGVNEVAMRREMEAPFRRFQEGSVGEEQRQGEEPAKHSTPMRPERRPPVNRMMVRGRRPVGFAGSNR